MQDFIVWIDCEMTGLDIEKDHLIEIAVLITDKDLNVVAQGPEIVIHQSEEVMNNMNGKYIVHFDPYGSPFHLDWCKTHHGEASPIRSTTATTSSNPCLYMQSGLTAKVLASSIDIAQAEEQVLQFIQHHVPSPGMAPLAGNTVHTDKRFLEKEMPRIVKWLHYRIIDVSTVKELTRRWHVVLVTLCLPILTKSTRYPDLPKMNKKEVHRAMDDIKESIEELRYYRQHVFVKGP
ncbi:hypothetical protein BZG36_00062 [Bifiguratus adelaidae]|uniref:Exonuclease domain-containing protein n=1 Tax=Bifiguratus adelaidae TaxID=1938954 RepID=A0A261Y869_9FUNG|nr:hypothetical protein BZG36_00062 [Bifiguratus adelaidae]